MLRALFTLLLLLVTTCAIAQDDVPTLDGERFVKRFVSDERSIDKFVEFVREEESFQIWTKLIGFRLQRLPGLGNDPKRAAGAMAQVLRGSNPNVPLRVIANDQLGEALIDFVMRTPDGKFMEFNVWRYIKSTDGNGVISLQLAYRFADVTPEGIERFKGVRASWIKQALAFDMGRVRAEFGQ